MTQFLKENKIAMFLLFLAAAYGPLENDNYENDNGGWDLDKYKYDIQKWSQKWISIEERPAALTLLVGRRQPQLKFKSCLLSLSSSSLSAAFTTSSSSITKETQQNFISPTSGHPPTIPQEPSANTLSWARSLSVNATPLPKDSLTPSNIWDV